MVHIWIDYNIFKKMMNEQKRCRFSDDALELIYDYITISQSDCDEIIITNLTTICDRFVEYTNIDEAMKVYGYETKEELEQNECVLYTYSDSIVIDLL